MKLLLTGSRWAIDAVDIDGEESPHTAKHAARRKPGVREGRLWSRNVTCGGKYDDSFSK